MTLKLTFLMKVMTGLFLLIGAVFIGVKYKEELNKCAPYKGVYSSAASNVPLEHLNILDGLDSKSLEIGKAEMAKHKIVICGIARDAAPASAVMFKAIENLGSEFLDYKVVIFENDSTDGTKEALKDWQENNNKVKVVSKNYEKIKRPTIKFMADARNEYIKVIENDPEYADFDVAMVIDMDMEYGVDSRGTQHSFSKFDRWDAVCANGIYNYKSNNYDRFAFNKDEVLPTPDGTAADYNNVARGEKRYDIHEELVPVLSCFGGFAFYKKAAIIDVYMIQSIIIVNILNLINV